MHLHDSSSNDSMTPRDFEVDSISKLKFIACRTGFLILYNRFSVSSSRKVAVSRYGSVAERTKAILASSSRSLLHFLSSWNLKASSNRDRMLRERARKQRFLSFIRLNNAIVSYHTINEMPVGSRSEENSAEFAFFQMQYNFTFH